MSAENSGSAEQAGEQLRVKGHDVTCPICGGGHFTERTALLNTPGLTFFGLDWANKEAYVYICTNCGYILWFLPQ